MTCVAVPKPQEQKCSVSPRRRRSCRGPAAPGTSHPADKILPVDVGTRGAAGEGRLGFHGEERRYEHSLLTIFTSWIRSADDGEPARVYAGRASQRRQEPLGGGGCQRRREG